MRTRIVLLALLFNACNVPAQAPATASNQTQSTPIVGDPINGCDPAAEPFGGGSGASDDPFLICSAAQLGQGLSLGEYGELVTNIDLSGVSWTPVILQGTLDGQGYTVSSLTYDGSSASSPAGLFEEITGRLENISFKNIHVTIGSQPAGLVVGKNVGWIQNVSVTDSEILGTNMLFKTGGIVGENDGSITQSFAAVIIQGGQGGIAGNSSGTISYSDAAITAPASVDAPFDSSARVVYGNTGTLSHCTYGSGPTEPGYAHVENSGLIQTGDCN